MKSALYEREAVKNGVDGEVVWWWQRRIWLWMLGCVAVHSHRRWSGLEVPASGGDVTQDLAKKRGEVGRNDDMAGIEAIEGRFWQHDVGDAPKCRAAEGLGVTWQGCSIR